MLGGWGSVVGTATCCGQDGPWFEPRWGRDFLYPSKFSLFLIDCCMRFNFWYTLLHTSVSLVGVGICRHIRYIHSQY